MATFSIKTQRLGPRATINLQAERGLTQVGSLQLMQFLPQALRLLPFCRIPSTWPGSPSPRWCGTFRLQTANSKKTGNNYLKMRVSTDYWKG